MSTSEHVLVSHHGAAWLPEGGRADVVLAGKPALVPAPVCLVRLLVTRGSSLLVEPRPDGRGLDIPSRKVREGAWEGAVEDLLRQALGSVRHATLLGYVRNDVPGEPEDYPWPLPHAYFAVWHYPLPGDDDATGTWLHAAEAEAHLADRHWWPLAARGNLEKASERSAAHTDDFGAARRSTRG